MTEPIGSLIFSDQGARGLLENAKRLGLLADEKLLDGALQAAGVENLDDSREIVSADISRIAAVAKDILEDQKRPIGEQRTRLKRVRELALKLYEAIQNLGPQERDKWAEYGPFDSEMGAISRWTAIRDRVNEAELALLFFQHSIPDIPKVRRGQDPKNTARREAIYYLYKLYELLTEGKGALRWTDSAIQSDHDGPFLEFCKVCLQPVFDGWVGTGLEDDIKKALRNTTENTSKS